MSGSHTSEKRWLDQSDLVGRRLGRLQEFLIANETLFQELLELWNYHGNDDQSVADQLFQASPASATQLQQVQDMKAAMLAAHTLYTVADWAAIRRMSKMRDSG